MNWYLWTEEVQLKNLIVRSTLCFVFLIPMLAASDFSTASARRQKAADHAARDYQVLGADNKHIAIVNATGEVEWEVPNNAPEVHDIQMLSNGNVLFQTSYTTVVEMSRDKKIVWQHESKPKEGYTGRVEIHSYRRLKDGLTMIAESGNTRIIEVDQDDKIVREIPLTVEKPSAH